MAAKWRSAGVVLFCALLMAQGVRAENCRLSVSQPRLDYGVIRREAVVQSTSVALGTRTLHLIQLGCIEHGPCADDCLGHLVGDRPDGVEPRIGAQRDLENRQPAPDERPRQRHRGIERLDGQDRDDRCPCGNGRYVHCQTLQPPSITFTVPVVKADSSLAR